MMESAGTTFDFSMHFMGQGRYSFSNDPKL
jgi:hypothetical protein